MTGNPERPPAPPSRPLPRSKRFRPHLCAFLAVFTLTLVLNLGFGAGLPLFWPLAAWSVALAVHFFIASAHDVNERWVDDRAMEVRMRSYDFDHIRDIKERAANRENSLTHPLERDREKKD